MARKPYRVEVSVPSKGNSSYYLVRDVKVKGLKRKVRKYIGSKPPTAAELDRLRRENAYEMEMRAAKKKAEMSSSFLSTQYITRDQLVRLEYLRYLYDTFTDLLTVNEVDYYEKEFEVVYVQGTTAIEGNTLTVKETRDLLVDNIVPPNKQLRELNEIQNFRNVARYRNGFKGRVTLEFIRKLHALIMDKIDYESAGTFRRIDALGITGCELKLTPALLVESDLEKLIALYYRNLEKGKNPFEQAVLFHYEFEMIHPFTDGNGRVGREVLNYMLVRSGYPRMLFLGKDRARYIGALRLGNEERCREMISVFIDIISEQRQGILDTNLRRVIENPKKPGQARLDDFVKT
jgi:Fic family protein